MLVRLLYASRIAPDAEETAIEAILQQSRANNPRSGITGVLCHNGEIFMQALEGGRNAVSERNIGKTDQRYFFRYIYPPLLKLQQCS